VVPKDQSKLCKSTGLSTLGTPSIWRLERFREADFIIEECDIAAANATPHISNVVFVASDPRCSVQPPQIDESHFAVLPNNVRHLQETIDEAQKQIRRRREAEDELRNENLRLREAKDELRGENQRLHAILESVFRSTSWRSTAPLRAAMRWLRNFGKHC
jgi:hypothetical protein